jgi:precorrin-2 methylase
MDDEPPAGDRELRVVAEQSEPVDGRQPHTDRRPGRLGERRVGLEALDLHLDQIERAEELRTARGSLAVVGIGIEVASHLTQAAREEIESADVVLCLVAEPVAAAWLAGLNGNVRSLHGHYRLGDSRVDAYTAMTEEILDEVRAGKRVCVAFYGHPGIFVTPSHEAIRGARDEGFEARMLPGVSAEDCLFADLGVDPARFGCQSYEATDFLVRRRLVDTSTALVLWQVGTVGSEGAAAEAQPTGLAVLVERLLEHYPPNHEAVLYEASSYVGFAPLIRRVPLGELRPEHVTAMATLYLAPLKQAPIDAAVLERLGLPPE